MAGGPWVCDAPPVSESPKSERRRAARVPVSVPIEIRTDRGFSLHSTSDLSAGGAFFGRAIPNEVGSRVSVAVNLPGEPPILCEGEVVNVPDRRNFGMGVRFLNLSEDDQKRLEAFTGNVEPK